MIRSLLLLVGLASGIAISALAQTVPTPPNCAIAGAYNSATQTITTGNFGLVQVDVNGYLRMAP